MKTNWAGSPLNECSFFVFLSRVVKTDWVGSPLDEHFVFLKSGGENRLGRQTFR